VVLCTHQHYAFYLECNSSTAFLVFIFFRFLDIVLLLGLEKVMSREDRRRSDDKYLEEIEVSCDLCREERAEVFLPGEQLYFKKVIEKGPDYGL